MQGTVGISYLWHFRVMQSIIAASQDLMHGLQDSDQREDLSPCSLCHHFAHSCVLQLGLSASSVLLGPRGPKLHWSCMAAFAMSRSQLASSCSLDIGHIILVDLTCQLQPGNSLVLVVHVLKRLELLLGAFSSVTPPPVRTGSCPKYSANCSQSHIAHMMSEKPLVSGVSCVVVTVLCSIRYISSTASTNS